MNAWEKRLDTLCKAYEPDSLLVQSGLWSVRWAHAPATAAAWLQLWYIDRGAQFERVFSASIPYTFPCSDLAQLFKAKMHTAEAMLEAQFTA